MELDNLVIKSFNKMYMPLLPAIFRSLLAGIYISFGCVFMSVVKADLILPTSISNILSGLVFSIGLILVTLNSGELFTGNCTIISVIFHKRCSSWKIIGNANYKIAECLMLNYVLNMVGTALVAGVISIMKFNIPVIEAIGTAKFSKSPVELFFSGLLCNALVCLSVIINSKTSNNIEKIIVNVFAVTMFVACGFEHSIADLFFMFLANLKVFTIHHLLASISIITIGNIVGGMLVTVLTCMSCYKEEQHA